MPSDDDQDDDSDDDDDDDEYDVHDDHDDHDHDKIQGKAHDDNENLALKRDGALVTESGYKLLKEDRRLVALRHLHLKVDQPHIIGDSYIFYYFLQQFCILIVPGY